MATMIQGQPGRGEQFWLAIQNLEFLSTFFSWFFMLLTRLSEPLMLLSTLYVIAEAGVPVIAEVALHNVAIGVMITAPEIILPGSFVVAARALEQKEPYARLLFAACWLFIALTTVTLISLFVWHFTGVSLAWLMCARCAVGVGYSVLMRVMSHGRSGSVMIQSEQRMNQVEAVMNHLVELMNQQGVQLNQAIEQAQVLNQQGVQSMVQGVQQAVEQMNQCVIEATLARPLVPIEPAGPLDEPGGSVCCSIEPVKGFRMKPGQFIRVQQMFSQLQQHLPVGVQASVLYEDAEPVTEPVPVQRQGSVTGPLNLSGFSEPEHGSDEELNPVSQRARQFIADYLAAHDGSMPTLTMIMEAAGCSKGTASQVRNRMIKGQ